MSDAGKVENRTIEIENQRVLESKRLTAPYLFPSATAMRFSKAKCDTSLDISFPMHDKRNSLRQFSCSAERGAKSMIQGCTFCRNSCRHGEKINFCAHRYKFLATSFCCCFRALQEFPSRYILDVTLSSVSMSNRTSFPLKVTDQTL